MNVDEINRTVEIEGWAVFDSAGSANGPWQIQRFDEEAIFDDDTAAWCWVWAQACRGSEPHVAALAFVAEHNPQEFESIVNWIDERP